MNGRTGGWAAKVSRGTHLVHTVRAARRRGKSLAGQLVKGSCERATQVILEVSVTTGKARTAATQQFRDSRYGCSLSQQLFSDPLVGNTPIGVRESLWNPQPLQPSLVDVASRRGGTGCGDHQLAGERPWQRSGSGDGAGGASYLSLGCLYQQRAVGSQPNLRLHQLHPGGVPVALTPEGFLIGEPGQPTQMTPVGTGQVAAIRMGQLSGDDGGYGRFQPDSTDLNPSLEMAGAGLEHHTGLMPIGPHPLERGRIGVVQIQQDVTGICGCPQRAECRCHSPHDCERAGILPSPPCSTGRPSRAFRLGMRFWWRGESVEPNRAHVASTRVAVKCRATRETDHDQT
jgi:hypothetical protein